MEYFNNKFTVFTLLLFLPRTRYEVRIIRTKTHSKISRLKTSISEVEPLQSQLNYILRNYALHS